jgi:hypothetical protein
MQYCARSCNAISLFTFRTRAVIHRYRAMHLPQLTMNLIDLGKFYVLPNAVVFVLRVLKTFQTKQAMLLAGALAYYTQVTQVFLA